MPVPDQEQADFSGSRAKDLEDLAESPDDFQGAASDVGEASAEKRTRPGGIEMTRMDSDALQFKLMKALKAKDKKLVKHIDELWEL